MTTRRTFAALGHPDTIESDNGTCLIGDEFELFFKPAARYSETSQTVLNGVQPPPPIKQLKTAHARSIDRKTNYAADPHQRFKCH